MTETPPPAPEAPRSFETQHEGRFHDTLVPYRAIAAETHVPGPDGKPWASIFSFSYLADAPDPERRPVTFIFNGGPGSASLWLHMGAFGPRRLIVPSDATHAGTAPYTVEDNALCLLDKTDLVFIDPPGTGFSKMLPPAKPEDGWGLTVDAQIVAGFIRTWLTAHKRWSSPRHLWGESYGTTRAVAVAGELAAGLSGVAFNSLGLISAILDFHTARFQAGNPLPDVCFLPTYAATALHHGAITPPPPNKAEFLAEVRQFATAEYLPALFAGARLDLATRSRVRRKLARYTGLSETWLERTRLRIDAARFRRELLRDRGATVGRLDSRYLGTEYDQVGEYPEGDPAGSMVDSAFVSAMNDHMTRQLGIDWGRPYQVFNRDALTKWDWYGKPTGAPTWPGYVNVAPTLGRLLREQANLKVLIANGYLDIATPFFAVESTISGNGIDSTRIQMTYYEAGHMMYLHQDSYEALVTDMRALL